MLEQLIDGEEKIERNSERHFFVVDVCAEDDQVLKLLINERFLHRPGSAQSHRPIPREVTRSPARLNPYKIN